MYLSYICVSLLAVSLKECRQWRSDPLQKRLQQLALPICAGKQKNLIFLSQPHDRMEGSLQPFRIVMDKMVVQKQGQRLRLLADMPVKRQSLGKVKLVLRSRRAAIMLDNSLVRLVPDLYAKFLLGVQPDFLIFASGHLGHDVGGNPIDRG